MNNLKHFTFFLIIIIIISSCETKSINPPIVVKEIESSKLIELDKKYGIAHLRLGTDKSELKGIKKEYLNLFGHKLVNYVKKNEIDKIGSISVKKIYYSFYKDKLRTITIETKGIIKDDQLNIFIKKYGQPKKDTSYHTETYTWEGKKVILLIENSGVFESLTAYKPSYYIGKIRVTSKDLQEKMLEEEKEMENRKLKNKENKEKELADSLMKAL